MPHTEKSSIKLVLGTANVGDTAIDPMARYDTPDEVNAFLDVWAKRGYDQIDSGAAYSPGAPGTSEPRIGAVSAGDKFKIDTKTNWFEGHTKESVSRDIDASLKILKIEQINTYYLHVADRKNPPEPAIEALDQAYREGKIKSWGVSNYRADEVQTTIDICEKHGFVKPSVYQGQYNAIVRGGEKELFPILRKNGMAFYAYSAAAGGVYVSLYVKPTIDAAVDKALEVASKYDIGGHAAALRWTAHHSILNKQKGDALVVGASSPEQLESNIDVIEEGPLPDDLAAAFEAVYEEAGDEIKYHL
ncbi:hypothetical protein FSARC_7365 [Fusarium sarcochroum]|uniref:NADP-dependent oxidoreductase domain-containing protein n=1 Tax=Fusarium sarcochroum TaxID=1208366 RepID=A0A8H4TVF1_9HYPO|nr:hypothetical protein FSARC_7365 [Fusarium sarcochroum]